MNTARILIVDDNKFNLNVLQDLLKEYTVITANDGRSALRLVMAEKPDLVLLDVIMPGVDGISVLSILKNAEETRHIPVAVVTALSDTAERDKLFEKGADDFITKPFSPVELQARVRTLLRVKDLSDEIQNVTDAFVAMALKIYSSSRYFEHHSSQTATYAEQIARKRITSPRDRNRIKLAALLLDVGRLEIKDDILLMPDKFGPDEWQAMKAHPLASEKLCSQIAAFKPLLPLIRHHHERYDGKGYPDQLQGAEIPLGARILAVADAFDALTTERPHRPAYSTAQALEIMKENSGPQWDPEIVELFLDLVKTNAITLSAS